MIEVLTEGELNKCGWKSIYWSIECTSKSDMSEGWKIVHRMIEFMSKGEVSEGGRKSINWLVETISKGKVSECTW